MMWEWLRIIMHTAAQNAENETGPQSSTNDVGMVEDNHAHDNTECREY